MPELHPGDNSLLKNRDLMGGQSLLCFLLAHEFRLPLLPTTQNSTLPRLLFLDHDAQKPGGDLRHTTGRDRRVEQERRIDEGLTICPHGVRLQGSNAVVACDTDLEAELRCGDSSGGGIEPFQDPLLVAAVEYLSAQRLRKTHLAGFLVDMNNHALLVFVPANETSTEVESPCIIQGVNGFHVGHFGISYQHLPLM